MEDRSLARTLEARALALLIINCAKHKAAGKTHRISIRIYGVHGYKKTVVFYTRTTEPERYAIRKATELDSRVLSDYEVRVL